MTDKSSILNDWSSYYDIKRLTQWECQKAFNNYIAGFNDAETNCTKKLWSFVKSRRLDQTSIGPINYKRKPTLTHYPKLAFADYFSSVYAQDDPSNIPTLEGEPFPDIQQIHINLEGVIQLLLNLKPYKAAGPDNLPCYFLKMWLMRLPLPCVWSFRPQGMLPEIWKSASVVPIYKKMIQATTDQCH